MLNADLDSFVAGLDVLGPASGILRPPGYPQSLGMCILDSIWSLGVNYTRHVEPVLRRYAQARAFESPKKVTDSSSDLATFIESIGGADAFATTLHNRQMTSTRGGVLKAEAVRRAADVFARAAVDTTDDLLANSERVRAEWRSIPGQRSSSTGWRYLLLLAGAREVKPDRMVCRFIADRIGRTPSLDEAHDLVIEAAVTLGLDPAALDHSIWRFQSGRSPRATNEVQILDV